MLPPTSQRSHFSKLLLNQYLQTYLKDIISDYYVKLEPITKEKKMNIEPSIFREYDIRGTYPEQINEASIKLIAHAIARKCRETGIDNIVVGRDGRLSGLSLLNSFCSGLLECGINVNNIGLVTSPLLYYAAKKSISKSGVMITGSHNPKNYNGIKMVINDSPISGTEIHSLISTEDSNN